MENAKKRCRKGNRSVNEKRLSYQRTKVVETDNIIVLTSTYKFTSSKISKVLSMQGYNRDVSNINGRWMDRSNCFNSGLVMDFF